jgi:hypothetical protein
MTLQVLAINDPYFMFALGFLAVAFGLLGLLILFYEVKLKDIRKY